MWTVCQNFLIRCYFTPFKFTHSPPDFANIKWSCMSCCYSNRNEYPHNIHISMHSIKSFLYTTESNSFPLYLFNSITQMACRININLTLFWFSGNGQRHRGTIIWKSSNNKVRMDSRSADTMLTQHLGGTYCIITDSINVIVKCFLTHSRNNYSIHLFITFRLCCSWGYCIKLNYLTSFEIKQLLLFPFN